MLVGMNVIVVAGAMSMRITYARLCATGRKRVVHPLQQARQVKDAQENQHQSHRKLHREANTLRHHPAEQNNSASDQKNRERVTHTPKSADDRSVADLSVSCDDGGNGNDVIGIRGVPHP